MDEYCLINDFAKKIGQHQNTVDGWFKQLEERRIHYVNRANGKKVYNSLDLQIGLYIRDKREKKWALDPIFSELPEHFELRPFPPDNTATSG
ncbi:hypothetical protein [Brevibacillus sp. AY1]|uniref:hypothetical protein n=1 Tax=Brevibacillus sp. AY1 TaxID=2807621 RepID=UPI002456325A|nr:hypothetical protein [Brevibacillus sp. AY1]MDH4619389.1 hypothetical protein [Brevibacillus sp. AY1]